MAGSDHRDRLSFLKSASSFVLDRSFSCNSTHESTKNANFSKFGLLKKPMAENNFVEGKVKKLCNSFEAALSKKLSNSKLTQKHLANGNGDSDIDSLAGFKRSSSAKQFGCNQPSLMKSIRSISSSRFSPMFDNRIRLPGTEDRIVVYLTSLRGIRRTYEDCYAARTILKGFRVPVDERDISMDSAYRKELQNVLGAKTVSLPQVFIRGKYIGGAEEIKQLHEVGDLVKLLKGFPLRDPRSVCESCGDARFVPCFNCNGSRKVFCEEEDIMRRCLDCNENGLMRCPNCCY